MLISRPLVISQELISCYPAFSEPQNDPRWHKIQVSPSHSEKEVLDKGNELLTTALLEINA